MTRLLAQAVVLFAKELGKALVREAAFMTARAARRRIEARDRYVEARRIQYDRIDLRQVRDIPSTEDQITYGS